VRFSAKPGLRLPGFPRCRKSPSADAYAALEESQTFQQFSTPIPLGLVAACAAAITPADRVLEPSAGTGLLAIFAEIAGGALVLNELADTRASLLSLLFPAIPVTRFDAAQIDDHLDPAVTPSVVLMNPPFSAMANVEGRIADTTYRHVASALARLPRRATGDDHRRQLRARQSGLAGRLHSPAGARAHRLLRRHRRRGLCQTRHDVSDAADRHRQAARRRSGRVPGRTRRRLERHAAGLARRSFADTARRRSLLTVPAVAASALAACAAISTAPPRPSPPPCRWPSRRACHSPTRPRTAAGEGGRLSDGIYEEYGLQAIRIAGSQAHPTRLVQSAAMASVAPPRPSYRPHLPVNIHELLSDAQLETVIYAGEAHADHLPDRGRWTPPSMSSPPRARMRRTPRASGAAS
jgi:predicted RNA methylase